MKRLCWRRWAAALALVLPWLWLGTGCVSYKGGELVAGTPYKPTNVFGRDTALSPGIRRVAMLPITCPVELEDGRAMVGTVPQEELSKTRRFELASVSTADLVAWTGKKQLRTVEVLPQELLQKVREVLGCDAVLFSELTQFKAYPPLAVGWSFKLVDARTGQLLWAADELFDASHPDVVTGARHYQADHGQVGGSLGDTRFILLTPSAFAHYSAGSLFALLPPAAGS
jgi:hypothetical protein